MKNLSRVSSTRLSVQLNSLTLTGGFRSTVLCGKGDFLSQASLVLFRGVCRSHNCKFLGSSDAFTLTQNADADDTIPVIFTGLQEGARDSTVVDDEDKQQSMSTVNPDVPHFQLLTDSEGEDDIPLTQPRYHLSDMWW